MIKKLFNNVDFRMIYYVKPNNVVILGKETRKFNLNNYDELVEMIRFMETRIKMNLNQIGEVLDIIELELN